MCTSLHLPSRDLWAELWSNWHICEIQATFSLKLFVLSSFFFILFFTATGEGKGAARYLWAYLLPVLHSSAQQHQEIQNGFCLPCWRYPKIQCKGRFQALNILHCHLTWGTSIPHIYYYNQLCMFSSLNKQRCKEVHQVRWGGLDKGDSFSEGSDRMLLCKKSHSLGWAEAFLLS